MTEFNEKKLSAKQIWSLFANQHWYTAYKGNRDYRKKPLWVLPPTIGMLGIKVESNSRMGARNKIIPGRSQVFGYNDLTKLNCIPDKSTLDEILTKLDLGPVAWWSFVIIGNKSKITKLENDHAYWTSPQFFTNQDDANEYFTSLSTEYYDKQIAECNRQIKELQAKKRSSN